ncbi:SMEK domain-containing protein [Fibrella aquatilis]|uniref:SMEK domain-containing protein n=1 Tax=Fibrella aquatilis TaxID=2817059 RepID=A0A939JWF4_9BACT|nr:SMEK domain-containing protein [Fibrella aquatilis]MBO0931852.1 SMEK domain-containing protein [Fibrella aquatilis]
MNSRELLLKTISNEFAKWQVQIANLNSLNLYDANIFSEYTLCEMLNLIFDYKLVNANLLAANYPAADLIDKENKIAIQVTSTAQKNKIQATLNKFIEYNLHLDYDQVFIVILGDKQKSYSTLVIPSEITFDKSEQILDFKDVLNIIARLPLHRIEKIAKLLSRESIRTMHKRPNSSAIALKKKLSLKKRIQKDLLRTVSKEQWECLWYEPWVKFRYHNVIIRSVNDKTWPEVDYPPKTKISTWFKGEFWNFYENGIELISHGDQAIFDENGYWDLLDLRGDARENDKKFRVANYHTFLRIPYEYIVEYDMEPDDYYGVPTIYVEYANDDTPYEKVLYGRMGHYDKKNPSNSHHTYYFEEEKRRDLK